MWPRATKCTPWPATRCGHLGGLQPGRQAGGDGQRDSTAKVWDVATGEEVHTLAGHAGTVTSAVFSPDGTLIVTASDDNTARCGTRRRVQSYTPWPATRMGSTRRSSARTAGCGDG